MVVTKSSSIHTGGIVKGDLKITGNLTVDGNFNFGDASTDILRVNGIILNANGSLSAPSYSFASEPSTGFYFHSSGAIAWSSNGSVGGRFLAGVLFVNNVRSLSSIYLGLLGQAINSTSAVAMKIGNANALSYSSAKIVIFYNDFYTTEKAYITSLGYFGWISSNTQTTVGSAGGASPLPNAPAGYAKIDVNGTTYVIPYYNES